MCLGGGLNLLRMEQVVNLFKVNTGPECSLGTNRVM